MHIASCLTGYLHPVVLGDCHFTDKLPFLISIIQQHQTSTISKSKHPVGNVRQWCTTVRCHLPPKVLVQVYKHKQNYKLLLQWHASSFKIRHNKADELWNWPLSDADKLAACWDWNCAISSLSCAILALVTLTPLNPLIIITSSASACNRARWLVSV